MGIISEIRESALLNCVELNTSFTCFQKPFSILSDCIRPMSSYFYLLFQDLRTPDFFEFYPASVEDIALEIPKIIIREETVDSVDLVLFYKTIRDLVDHKKFVMITVDLFYEEDSKNYGMHHCHSAILKGYNDNDKKITIIDEDYSTPNGLKYIEKSIDVNKLYKMACFNKDCSNSEELEASSCLYFPYLILDTEPQLFGKSVSTEVIELFSNYTLEMYNKCDKFNSNMKGLVNNLISVFPEKYAHKVQKIIDNMNQKNRNFTLLQPELALFPTEVYGLFNHFYSLKSQFIVFSQSMTGCKEKILLIDAFNNIINKYSIIISFIRKSLLTNNVTHVEKVMIHLDNILPYEKNLYKLMLESIEYLKLNN